MAKQKSTTPEKVTAETVRGMLSSVRDNAGDPERAHVNEDTIWAFVLLAIAEGFAEDPAACAAEALKTREIKFDRWYA